MLGRQPQCILAATTPTPTPPSTPRSMVSTRPSTALIPPTSSTLSSTPRPGPPPSSSCRAEVPYALVNTAWIVKALCIDSLLCLTAG